MEFVQKHEVNMLRRAPLRRLIRRGPSAQARRRLVLIVGVLAVVVIAVSWLWYRVPGWFGGAVGMTKTETIYYEPGGERHKEITRTVEGPQTPLDWFALLAPLLPVAVPLVLAWYNSTQRVQSDLRMHDDALQAYLDEITKLLGEDRNPDDSAQSRVGPTLVRGDPAQESVASALVRTRTLTMLGRLRLAQLERRGLVSDATRKRHIVQFLYEADLIRGYPSVVSLAAADLSYADLKELDLSEANLSGANLSKADLRGAVLSDVHLAGANLDGAKVNKEQVATVSSLQGTTMPSGQTYEDWLKSTEGRWVAAENV